MIMKVLHMKKVLGFISVFLFSLIFSQSVFALEEENIDYNGNVYSKDANLKK